MISNAMVGTLVALGLCLCAALHIGFKLWNEYVDRNNARVDPRAKRPQDEPDSTWHASVWHAPTRDKPKDKTTGMPKGDAWEAPTFRDGWYDPYG